MSLLRKINVREKINSLILTKNKLSVYLTDLKDLKEFRKNITPDPIPEDTKVKIRALWGKESKWFSLYHALDNGFSKSQTPLYFPDGWFYLYVDLYLNDWPATETLDDKNHYDLLFHDIPQPKTIVRKCGGVLLDDDYQPITLQDAVHLCKANKEVIIKPAIMSAGGAGIAFWKNDQNEAELTEVLETCKDVVVQEVMQQHEVLSSIHKESINTIRILTLNIDGEIQVLSSVLRMGIGGARVDNASAGGIVVGIKEDGTLRRYAFTEHGKRFDGHPTSGKTEGIRVPGYDSCVALCKQIAPRLSRTSKLTSWDFAIGTDSVPILIEANLRYGMFGFHQMCNGPIFKDEETTRQMIDRFIKRNHKLKG